MSNNDHLEGLLKELGDKVRNLIPKDMGFTLIVHEVHETRVHSHFVSTGTKAEVALELRHLLSKIDS